MLHEAQRRGSESGHVSRSFVSHCSQTIGQRDHKTIQYGMASIVLLGHLCRSIVILKATGTSFELPGTQITASLTILPFKYASNGYDGVGGRRKVQERRLERIISLS